MKKVNFVINGLTDLCPPMHFAIKFLNQKRFLARLKSGSRSSLSRQGKCDVFLLELYLTIDPSNFASENDVTELSRLQMHAQK